MILSLYHLSLELCLRDSGIFRFVLQLRLLLFSCFHEGMAELPSFTFHPQIKCVRNQQEQRHPGKKDALNPSMSRAKRHGAGRFYTDRLFLLQADYSVICSPS